MRHAFAAILLLAAAGLHAQPPVEAPPLSEETYALLEYFYDYDASIPLEARVVEVKEFDDAIRRKVVFRGVRGFLVPGYLEIPKTAQPPYPVVLLMHGWSGSKEHWYIDDNYISGGNARKALLAEGFAVFALDAQGHGDRIAENDYQVVNISTDEGAPPRSNYFTLRDVIVQTAVDYRRAIDYLAARGDMDMDRLGAHGYSMGGFHTFALAAMEPRIKAAVGCVVPVTWRPDIVLDPGSYAARIRDTPYLMLMGKEDSLCNEAQARELFGLLSGPPANIVVYDCDHRLPAAYVPEAVAWLKTHLTGD